MASIQDFQFYVDRGISVIPIKPGTKQPLCKWSVYTERHATRDEIKKWAQFDSGVGLVLGTISGFIAVDADSKEAARKLWKALPATDMVTKTTRGGHMFFKSKNQIGTRVGTLVKGVKCDLKAERSYVLAFPSIHPTGDRYERWGNWTEAPEFDTSWLAQSKTRLSKKRIKHPSNYIAHVFAVAGQRGHDATFRAACVLRDAELSESEALAELIKWNETNCSPAWSIQELLHKVKSVYRGKT